LKICCFSRRCAALLGLMLLAAGACTAGVPNPDAPRSLSLRDALALAQVNNVSIRQRRADADAADASARSAQAQQKPSVSTTTYGTLGDSSNILTSSPGVAPQNIFAAPSRVFADQNLMVMVPLFTGGNLAGRTASARSQAAAAQAGVAGVRLTVSAEVTSAYANAALGNALVAVAQAQQSAEDEQVRVTEEKVQTGRLAPVDLLREQAAQAEARQGVLAAVNAQAQALVTLRFLLALPQSSALALTDTLDTLADAPSNLPLTLAAALADAKRRPELMAANAQVQAAQSDVRSAEGAYAPQVYGVAMGDASLGRDLQRAGYTLGLTASLPLYDGGQRRSDVDAAKARAKRAEADAQQAGLQVEQETASAWLTWQTATAQVEAATAGVTAAQEGYTLAALRYNAGKSTTAERLDALAAWVRAQGAFAEAQADVVTARAQLQAVIGRG
jgi:outer membrane protein TolC